MNEAMKRLISSSVRSGPRGYEPVAVWRAEAVPCDSTCVMGKKRSI